jgi:hypothetical protein
MDSICTWIYLDSPEEKSEYPQVGKQSHLPAFQKIYWRCVIVFFDISIQQNPQKRHILFSNKDWEALPVINGLHVGNYLKEKNVTLVTIPLTWQTPPGYFGKWRNQFYIFDILKFIETTYNQDDTFVVLDSDCIIQKPLNGLFDDIRKQGLLALPMPYDAQHNINGISRQDMRKIFSELDGKDPQMDPLYYGGEIFAASYPIIQQINAMAPSIWKTMLNRHQNGQIKFNEEAHFLSYCYYQIGQFSLLDTYIKRIWTAPHYNNVQSSDVNIPIWHLPSEKTGGIALLFKKRKQLSAILMAGTLGNYVGIPTRKYFLNWKQHIKYSWFYTFLKK